MGFDYCEVEVGGWSVGIFRQRRVDFYRMWCIVFQTDKMKNQGAEYYLQAWELILGYK